MKFPCKNCITFSMCQSKSVIYCKFLFSYLHSIKNPMSGMSSFHINYSKAKELSKIFGSNFRPIIFYTHDGGILIELTTGGNIRIYGSV